MAEESGKGIALVILGIVAIIAIVGLVLLFTGYSGAEGKFAVPAAKEYGGAVKGVVDPYARAFAGRAYEPTDSGVSSEFAAQTTMTTGGRAGTSDVAYGDIISRQAVDSARSYNRLLSQASVFFQARVPQGTVKAGDPCYIFPEDIMGIQWTSDPTICAYAQQQGTMRSTVKAWCTGDLSRAALQSHAGYNAYGQSANAIDPYEASITRDLAKACGIQSGGLNEYGYGGASGIAQGNSPDLA